MNVIKDAGWHESLLNASAVFANSGRPETGAILRRRADEALAEVTALRALVGELVEAVEAVLPHVSDQPFVFDVIHKRVSNCRRLIAKAKEQVK